jgi:hypothetical protein
MLICRLNDCSSMSELLSGHFVLSCASERSLIIRSIASSEFLLPSPILPCRIIKHEQKQIDENLINSLANVCFVDLIYFNLMFVCFQMHIEDEEYNPLYYEARKSKITLNTNLI